MKKLIVPFIILITLFWSCNDMYELQSEFEGEVVYPAKFDTIVGTIGYERVEIDLQKAGRIPSGQIKLGKAQKTKITYDDQEIIIDSLVSYVNIEGLTQSKLYRFKITTLDEYGNESVPQEIALIPYTSSDLASLAVSSPRIMASPSAAIVDWPSGLSSVLLDYYGLEFEYTDKNGVLRKGERGADSRFFVGNISAGSSVDIKMSYRVVPKMNGTAILDTVDFESSLTLNMPTSSSEFPALERDILEENGVTVFTADGVSHIEKLTYPVHANSLQDIFYFPNLKELDLTGGELFKLPSLKYDRNGVVDYVGGGDFSPFIKKVSDMPLNEAQALKDLLEAGILEKVKYHAKSMGIDEILEPFVESGVVEMIETPQSVLLDNQFHLDGIPQSKNWTLDITYPATDAPAGDNLQNVYKAVIKAKHGSFCIALPKEYMFNLDEYKYIKMKVFAPDKSNFEGIYAPYQQLWPRFMNRLWSFQYSDFGQSKKDFDPIPIADENLNKWSDVTIDISSLKGLHTRVLVLNIGKEPKITYAPTTDIVYYFANIRFEKE
uniref:DUF4998 domain-containing protein n=1 Tax=uncultured Draconibacterium sp. TaxID=1573823 RepID=UPI0032179276